MVSTVKPIITTTKRADGNVNEAAEQWRSRPADERFWNLAEMKAHAQEDYEQSSTINVQANRLHFEGDGREVVLVDPNGGHARMTHYSFGQLAGNVGAPAHYLRSLPSTLAAQCLTESFQDSEDEQMNMLLMRHTSNGLSLRGATSTRYARVWNGEIIDGLQRLEAKGWAVPPARPVGIANERTRIATAEDVKAFANVSAGGGIKVVEGSRIAPAGLYMSDHDVWAFMVDPTRPIDNGAGGQLFPFFCVQQSEVGDCSIWGMRGYLNGVCGNHIIWGSREVVETRVIHRGRASSRWNDMVRAMGSLIGRSTQEDEATIQRARIVQVAETAADAASLLNAKKILSRKDALAAIELGNAHQEDGGGDPLTVWGMVQGITRLAQTTPFADVRAQYDRAGGRVLEMAF